MASHKTGKRTRKTGGKQKRGQTSNHANPKPKKRGKWIGAIWALLKRNLKWLITTVISLAVGGTICIIAGSYVIHGNNNQQKNYSGHFEGCTFIENQVIKHITLTCDSKSFERYTMGEALEGVDVDFEKYNLPKIPTGVVLRDPPGLDRLADAIEDHYEHGRLNQALELARIGKGIVDPIITPYLNRTCSIETALAKHVTAIYVILAEEAWVRDDYDTAKRYSHMMVGLWGEHVTGDVYAMAAAIELDECGGSDSVLCGEAVKRFNRGDTRWLYDYLNRLARWGYLHPIIVHDKTKEVYLFSIENAFGLPDKLDYRTLYMKAKFPTKDGRMLENGELIVTYYRGFGRIGAGYIPDPNGRSWDKEISGSFFMPTAKKVGNQPRPGPKEK